MMEKKSRDMGAGSQPLPENASAYLNPRYWDERFASEEHYEWFKDYSQFRHLLRPLLTPALSVLEVGCGNSRLCEELLKDGVSDITCIDLSSVAVDRMRKRLSDQGIHGIKVVEADMLDLPFGSESFDLVIEKGTMDKEEPLNCEGVGQDKMNHYGDGELQSSNHLQQQFPG